MLWREASISSSKSSDVEVVVSGRVELNGDVVVTVVDVALGCV